MFNFFKKKREIKQPQKSEKDNKKAFTNPELDLEALYECSVQKQANDFVVAQYSTEDGSVVNVAIDSINGVCGDLQKSFEMNIAGQEIIFTYFAKQGFIGFNNCAILAQDWLINKSITAPCEDAIAVDYDINDCDGEVTVEDQNIIEELKKLSHSPKFKIKDICKKFAENKRKYGQALCIPLIDNVDYSVPFNIDAVSQGSYKGMMVVEPIWFTPVLDINAGTNPASKRFYQPTWFRLPNGKNIHYSWCIFNIYSEVSDLLKPTYYYGGIPLPQLLYEQVYAAHKTAKEAPMLAQSKRLNYMDGNTKALLGDEDILHKTLSLLSWTRNNWGWIIKKPDQTIGQLDTSLTDFDAVTMLGYQIVAAISGIPSARLLETSPKGWQSTGSYEDNNYRKLQQSIQNIDYVQILDFHYRLLAKSKLGIDKEYSCIFSDIDTPTEKERAEIREINSRTDATYINAGVISPEEVRGVLRADEKSGYNVLSEEIEGESAEGEADPFTFSSLI
ncbi:MAG: DUF1073 domain-containing protein [Clostridium sp.]|nr:DUF1073 domain-containing protein [Clostridium sp.]